MSRARSAVGASTVAIAASAALGLVSIRIFIVALYGLRESRGTLFAIAVALVFFAAPIVAPKLEGAVGRRGAQVVSMGCLAIAALAQQFVRPIPWWLGAGATALALITWSLLLLDARSPSSHGGAVFALAFVAGMLIDTAVHASFETWDPMWRPGWAAAVPTVMLAMASLVAIPAVMGGATPHERETSFARVLPVAALGPFLVLQVLFLHNIAFVDAVAGLAFGGGAATVLVGETLACLLIAWGPRRERWATTTAGAVIVALLVWVLPALEGTVAALTVVAASGLAGLGMSIAMSGGGGADRAASWRTSVSLALGSLVFAALVFAYQIHATSPLPVSNRLLPPMAAIMLGAACLGTPTGRNRRPESRRLSIVMVAMAVSVAVPLVLLVTVPAPASGPSDATSLRILSWNVHAAVDANGQLVPDVVADQIEAQRPDVVVLQEVARGWPIGGALDLARWLSARLDMPFVWGPAADEQFGNLVLSRVPIVASDTGALPFGAGPQQRSMLRVTLETAGGPVTIVGTHLESSAGTDTRTQQIQVVLEEHLDEPRTVIAGDMNMQPADTADVALFADAGFLSAQDEMGRAADSTARDPRFPGDRPDWIFVSSDLAIGSFHIVPSEVSDHRPLVVDVTV